MIKKKTTVKNSKMGRPKLSNPRKSVVGISFTEQEMVLFKSLVDYSDFNTKNTTPSGLAREFLFIGLASISKVPQFPKIVRNQILELLKIWAMNPENNQTSIYQTLIMGDELTIERKKELLDFFNTTDI